LLFLGEGRHDIGDASPNPYDPRPAQGTIPTLARRICASIDSESVALAWTEIRRFNRDARKAGYSAKIAAAVLVAARKFACVGTVVVADRDGKADRQAEMEEGVERARRLFPHHPTVAGLAVESVEAWTLGVPHRIAEELQMDIEAIRKHYPPRIPIESLSERSGKPEHRPKQLLEKLAQLKHRTDSTAFRQAIAERSEVAELERACPQGFAPFAAHVRAAFGQGP
jgi:hypothetical protein